RQVVERPSGKDAELARSPAQYARCRRDRAVTARNQDAFRTALHRVPNTICQFVRRNALDTEAAILGECLGRVVGRAGIAIDESGDFVAGHALWPASLGSPSTVALCST